MEVFHFYITRRNVNTKELLGIRFVYKHPLVLAINGHYIDKDVLKYYQQTFYFKNHLEYIYFQLCQDDASNVA